MIDLIGWAFFQLGNDFVNATVVGFNVVLRFSTESAFDAQKAFAAEEAYHFTKLVGVAIRR